MSSRRAFLKGTAIAAVPTIFNFPGAIASLILPAFNADEINFFFDGDRNYTDPEFYSKKLYELAKATKDQADFYGQGGAVAALEQAFAAVTGKEKAIFVPSGTMANQLALKILSGNNTKIFVQETSHIFRDEADAAQSVHGKRLIPLAKGQGNFTLDELKEAVDYHNQGEVFKSGIGAISIENPVRRMDGQVFKFDEMKKISAYCKEQGFKLHLDGARLHIASSYSGVSIKEYASCFDTVYISLYKYLGSGGGAILCGDAPVIDQMPHWIKVYGGTMFQSWPYALMALNNLKDIETRLSMTKQKGEDFVALINQTDEFQIGKMADGTNVFDLTIKGTIDYKKFNDLLREKGILMGRANKGIVKTLINETILKRDSHEILKAMKEAYSKAKTA
ncbi:aminotransferase class I/II-fold pyridoxal phosphate-dependent enzyme [bacterium]|nr:aminotransferase class I/II-fold pyridoxal phosphate-dependent enzyme [bacterium]